MIYTDFADLEKPDDVIEMFFDSNLSGGDVYKSNVCMTCNYLVGRGRYAELGETEDLLIPPSAALAGSVYKTVMAQVTAGKKYGSMSEDLFRSPCVRLGNESADGFPQPPCL